MNRWVRVGLVGLIGFAAVGAWTTGACVYQDARFLHQARLATEQRQAAQRLLNQDQAPAAAAKPVPPPPPP